MKKEKLIKECAKCLKDPRVDQWYRENLEGKSQYHTIQKLEEGIRKNEISIHEALCITLIVGIQWSVKFEGVD